MSQEYRGQQVMHDVDDDDDSGSGDDSGGEGDGVFIGGPIWAAAMGAMGGAPNVPPGAAAAAVIGAPRGVRLLPDGGMQMEFDLGQGPPVTVTMSAHDILRHGAAAGMWPAPPPAVAVWGAAAATSGGGNGGRPGGGAGSEDSDDDDMPPALIGECWMLVCRTCRRCCCCCDVSNACHACCIFISRHHPAPPHLCLTDGSEGEAETPAPARNPARAPAAKPPPAKPSPAKPPAAKPSAKPAADGNGSDCSALALVSDSDREGEYRGGWVVGYCCAARDSAGRWRLCGRPDRTTSAGWPSILTCVRACHLPDVLCCPALPCPVLTTAEGLGFDDSGDDDDDDDDMPAMESDGDMPTLCSGGSGDEEERGGSFNNFPGMNRGEARVDWGGAVREGGLAGRAPRKQYPGGCLV